MSQHQEEVSFVKTTRVLTYARQHPEGITPSDVRRDLRDFDAAGRLSVMARRGHLRREGTRGAYRYYAPERSS